MLSFSLSPRQFVRRVFLVLRDRAHTFSFQQNNKIKTCEKIEGVQIPIYNFHLWTLPICSHIVRPNFSYTHSHTHSVQFYYFMCFVYRQIILSTLVTLLAAHSISLFHCLPLYVAPCRSSLADGAGRVCERSGVYVLLLKFNLCTHMNFGI